jgi:hypothetical protein
MEDETEYGTEAKAMLTRTALSAIMTDSTDGRSGILFFSKREGVLIPDL